MAEGTDTRTRRVARTVEATGGEGEPAASGVVPIPHHNAATAIPRAKKLGIATKPPRGLPFKGTLAYAVSSLPGGKRTFMDLARRVEGDAAVLPFVHKFDSLNKEDQRKVSLDDLCESVQVSPADVLKAVVGFAFEVNQDVSNLIAAVCHPQVVKSTVKFAQKERGVRDREMLHQHANFLPQKGGPNINITTSATAQAAAQSTVQGDSSGLPDFEETTIANVRTLRGDDAS